MEAAQRQGLYVNWFGLYTISTDPFKGQTLRPGCMEGSAESIRRSGFDKPARLDAGAFGAKAR